MRNFVKRNIKIQEENKYSSFDISKPWISKSSFNLQFCCEIVFFLETDDPDSEHSGIWVHFVDTTRW